MNQMEYGSSSNAIVSNVFCDANNTSSSNSNNGCVETNKASSSSNLSIVVVDQNISASDNEIYITFDENESSLDIEVPISDQSLVINQVDTVLAEESPTITSNNNLRVPDCAPHFKPAIGMQFQTLQLGLNFYSKYATECGFVSRLGSTKIVKNVVKYKQSMCNKAGDTKAKGIKQRRQRTRVGCRAKVLFKRIASGEYQIYGFVEAHNHLLATPNTMVHLTQTRQLTLVHKKIIMDNSKVNQGPVKTFRMFKEYVRGYKNVGASLEDFKNFSRDVKKFIKDSDAQMLIEKFMHKKGMCDSFFFDFEVDEEGRLCRVFWADPIGIKNYSLFGNMTSFDTTFDMNTYRLVFAPFTGVDHHKKCVNFAAGLLREENIESFTWMFRCFLKAMGDRYPVCLVTDQALGIKGAVKKVFGAKTQHRYCMWHILKKLPEKVGPTISRDTKFLTEISSCIWGEDVEIQEFEERWKSILEKYELSDNEWLNNMYAIRTSWIPAYFRDMFLGGLMRTTSRSESENNFFGHFTNPHLTLVEFWMRFDSAIDAQRWKQSKLIADSKFKFPALFSPLPLEKHASLFYTPTIFFEFQDELKSAMFACGVESIRVENDDEYISIMDQERKKVYVVKFNSELETIDCSCKKFQRHGYLCSHAILVLKNKGFQQVPEKYMIMRWSRSATSHPVFDIDEKVNSDCATLNATTAKLSLLWSEMFSCVSVCEQKTECCDDLMSLLQDFKEKFMGDGSGSSKEAQLEMLTGVTKPSEIRILPPRQAKNSGNGKRMLSDKEKAVEESNKTIRLCKSCGEMTRHDTRNCPILIALNLNLKARRREQQNN